MSRKIETGCFAIIRETGCPVIIGRSFGTPKWGITWDCGTGEGEYTARELKRITKEEFELAESRQDLANFDLLCQYI